MNPSASINQAQRRLYSRRPPPLSARMRLEIGTTRILGRKPGRAQFDQEREQRIALNTKCVPFSIPNENEQKAIRSHDFRACRTVELPQQTALRPMDPTPMSYHNSSLLCRAMDRSHSVALEPSLGPPIPVYLLTGVLDFASSSSASRRNPCACACCAHCESFIRSRSR
jgi:hypothetical protein